VGISRPPVRALVGQTSHLTCESDFEGYHTQRGEHGGQSYQLFQATDDPNEITVLIEFDNEENARGWTEYLQSKKYLIEPEMSNIEISYLDLVEHEQL
jgi:heme-degrading monooxygenase HmoA